MASQSSYKAVSTTNLLVSLPAFHGIIWTGFSLCIVAFGIRLYSRYACFHRLLVDDCLMILSLTALLVNNIEDQLNLKHIYNLENVSNGIVEPGPDFLADTQKGVRAFGIAMLFAYIGIWLIKLNFIFFFKGLGAQSKAYVCFWWFVLGVTIACGAVSLGIMQYDCLFGSIEDVIIICAAPSTMKRTYTFFKLSCILDVISDALIICFPVSILWNVRISMRKKITLSAIFSLVAFTIAVTIVRGSIFGGVYKSIDYTNMKEMNITWIWFWFSIEFTISFLIACVVSFRALFAQRQKKANAKQHEYRERMHREAQGSHPHRDSLIRRAKRFHDGLVETLRSTERDDYVVASTWAAPPARTSQQTREDFPRGTLDSDSAPQQQFTRPSTKGSASLEA